MAARRPFWKWHSWKSIGFCLWPPSTCIWNWNSKANLTYAPETMSSTDRRTDGRTDKVNPFYPPSNFVGRGYNNVKLAVNDNDEKHSWALNFLTVLKQKVYWCKNAASGNKVVTAAAFQFQCVLYLVPLDISSNERITRPKVNMIPNQQLH